MEAQQNAPQLITDFLCRHRQNVSCTVHQMHGIRRHRRTITEVGSQAELHSRPKRGLSGPLTRSQRAARREAVQGQRAWVLLGG